MSGKEIQCQGRRYNVREGDVCKSTLFDCLIWYIETFPGMCKVTEGFLERVSVNVKNHRMGH